MPDLKQAHHVKPQNRLLQLVDRLRTLQAGAIKELPGGAPDHFKLYNYENLPPSIPQAPDSFLEGPPNQNYADPFAAKRHFYGAPYSPDREIQPREQPFTDVERYLQSLREL